MTTIQNQAEPQISMPNIRIENSYVRNRSPYLADRLKLPYSGATHTTNPEGGAR